MFVVIDQMGGTLLRTIGLARADFAITMMAACYNLTRLVYLQKVGVNRVLKNQASLAAFSSARKINLQ